MGEENITKIIDALIRWTDLLVGIIPFIVVYFLLSWDRRKSENPKQGTTNLVSKSIIAGIVAVIATVIAGVILVWLGLN